MKILVSYFSATNTTKKVATLISEMTNSDLFEIKPKVPYSYEDLDWTNKNSRSSLEMKDPLSRPEISNKVQDFDKYDVILIGFPIWWYRAPTIINTFLESYDFSKKIIIPFATSGGSRLGKTNDYLKESVSKTAIIKEGRVFNNEFTASEIKNWLKDYLN